MKSNRTIYQTVSDTLDPDNIESMGPIYCTEDPWLGDGFYFWDSSEENAHDWGKSHYRANYVILKYSCSLDKCFDLYDDPECREFCKRTNAEIMIKKNLRKSPTLPQIIEYLKKDREFLKHYQGVRMAPFLYKRKNLIPIKNNISIDIDPTIQLCLFNKTSLSLSRGKIIYPQKYCQESDFNLINY